MGRGGTPYVEIVPRLDGLSGVQPVDALD